MAESLRGKLSDKALAPLFAILAEHRAALKCQFDAFAEYVAAAEENGIENYPLYQWTKATIEDPAKKEKYLKSFTLYVDDREVYAKEIADALEADLQPLATSGLITRISKYDTNPANNPQPPERPRERSSPTRERAECPLLRHKADVTAPLVMSVVVGRADIKDLLLEVYFNRN
jgi:hypothetical protein